MGEMSSSLVSVAVAGEGFRPPFTAVQWQELEQQALVYKYLMAGLPVPPELVITIRRSFEALSDRFFHHSNCAVSISGDSVLVAEAEPLFDEVGYCSYYGKKFDPEPGRCRRTDGKKWRCSKDAYLDSKYCERHMHRGRNRSRKPVEFQSTSQSLPNAMQHITTGSSGSGGIFQGSASQSFPAVKSETLCYESNLSKLQMEQPSPYGVANKEYRYLQRPTPDVDEHNSSPVVLGTVRSFGMDPNMNNAWPVLPSQVHSSSLLKSRNDDVPQAYERDDAAMANKRQLFFFGNDSSSLVPVKQGHHLTRPFLDECPKPSESWPELDDRYNRSAISTPQLSISIPVAPSPYSAKIGCPDADVRTS